MNLKLEGKWELVLDDKKVIEYDNYVQGFVPFKDNELNIETLRVFVGKDNEKNEKYVLIFPWFEGETYTSSEDLVPIELQKGVKNIIVGTDFYKTL